MTVVAWSILAAGWGIWIGSLLRIRPAGMRAQTIDRRARFGVLLQSLAYWVLFFSAFWHRQAGLARIVATIAFAVSGCILVYTARRVLGRHWRIDAGLNSDHQLIQSGPYRLVRHPIYLSMFLMLLATGMASAPLQVLTVSVVLFAVGTQIRATVEDVLLASRFGDEFHAYRNRVSSWIPFPRTSTSDSR